MILIISVNVIISKKQTQPQNYRCLDFSCYNYHNFFSFLQFSDKGMSDSKNKQIKKNQKQVITKICPVLKRKVIHSVCDYYSGITYKPNTFAKLKVLATTKATK